MIKAKSEFEVIKPFQKLDSLYNEAMKARKPNDKEQLSNEVLDIRRYAIQETDFFS